MSKSNKQLENFEGDINADTDEEVESDDEPVVMPVIQPKRKKTVTPMVTIVESNASSSGTKRKKANPAPANSADGFFDEVFDDSGENDDTMLHRFKLGEGSNGNEILLFLYLNRKKRLSWIVNGKKDYSFKILV